MYCFVNNINKPLHCRLCYAILNMASIVRFDLVCWFESYPLWVCFNIKVSPTEIYKILKQFESWNRFCFSFILNTLLRAPLLKLCKSISKCLSAASLTDQHFIFIYFFVTHVFISFYYIVTYYTFLFSFLFIFYITHFIHRDIIVVLSTTVNICSLVSLNPIRLGPLEPTNLISTLPMCCYFYVFVFQAIGGQAVTAGPKS